MFSRASAVLAVCLWLPVSVSASEDLAQDVGPTLSAASNFSHGWSRDTLRRATEIGVEGFRDGMQWSRAEVVPGRYDFTGMRTLYPVRIAERGATLGVVLNWGSPLYDGGDTPHSPQAVAAFGDFAAELARRYKAITNLEIGNEFNGVNFVRGPIAQMTPTERARAYVPLLAAASEGARAVRPDIDILGGATHSLPVGYLWEMLDAGARPYLDALAVHPYTTPAEQLVRQVAVLRRHPLAADLPLEVTEFGDPDPDTAADHFLKHYCQMALSGVIRAAWYPLNARGDGMVPLFRRNGRITGAGLAYRLAGERMEGRPAADAGGDPFTYGCRFGDDVLVLWGAPRAVDVAEDVTVLDATGEAVEGPHALDPERVLVFVRPDGAVEGGVGRGNHGLVADSFYQFAYPGGEDDAHLGGFRPTATLDGRDVPFRTMPGQERGGVPWFPYLGGDAIFPARLTAEAMVLASRGGAPVGIIHRHTAEADGEVRLDASFDVAERSTDGVAVTVTLDGTRLERREGGGLIDISLAIPLRAGSILEVAVDPGESAEGDVLDYRIGLSRQ